MSKGVNESISLLCDKLEDFVSSKTVVGEAITIGNVVLLPLVEVSFGMGAAGGDTADKNPGEKLGGGLGAKIAPSAILAIIDGNIQLINIKNQDAVTKLIDMVPGVVNKLNFGSNFNKKDEEEVKEEVKFEEKTIVE